MVYCSKCGAQVPDDASFCSKCGAEVGKAAPEGAPEGSDWRMDKHMRHQMRREWRWGLHMSPEYRLIGAIFAGIIVILLGVLLYLAAAHVTPLVTRANFWAYLIVAIGAVMVLRAIISMAMFPRAYYHFGSIVGGVILIAIGAAWLSVTILGWGMPLWPLIIVGGGVLIIGVAVVSYLAKKA